jgi:L-ascorbate metabolism protein UlaG (beta-lactamase superfamily)
MTLTYFGHSCFLVEIDGHRLLFDPFISPNPKASAIDLNSLQADFVLLSHGHVDHIADAEAILKQTGAVLISNYEVVEWFKSKGIEKGVGMNIGGSYSLPLESRSDKKESPAAGKVKMFQAIHSSSMPDGAYGGAPAGFIVEIGEHCFYYSGDTALTLDMKLIGDQHDLDFAVLPIGDHFTMGAVDAALAAAYTGAGRVVGVHYDTFSPIEIDHAAAHRAFDTMDVELLLPAIGESIEL